MSKAFIKLNCLAGSRISDICTEAVKEAEKTGKPVYFEFNDTPAFVRPSDTPENVETRWRILRNAATNKSRQNYCNQCFAELCCQNNTEFCGACTFMYDLVVNRAWWIAAQTEYMRDLRRKNSLITGEGYAI